MNAYNRRNMKDWMHDKKRVRGCSQKNVEYMRQLKEAKTELGRIGTLTYFLLVKLGVTDARSMMRSATRQQNLIFAVLQNLKEYRVDPQWEKAFESDIKSIHTRTEWVYKICRENLRLTEHWPYFNEVGFDLLLDFDQFYTEDNSTVLDKILPDMERWEQNHQEDIAKHMDSVRHEIELRDRRRAEREADKKRTKEAEKAAKKAANDEVREMKKNDEAYRKRIRDLNKDLERTVRAAHGGWQN